MASASQSGDPPALVAFRELAAVLADPSLSASVDGFELQIRLRARADALVSGAHHLGVTGSSPPSHFLSS